MPAETPWLNDYKKSFICKRLLQTALGGLKLKLGFKASWYIYFLQIIIFLFPWFVGIPLTIIAELRLLDFPYPTLIMSFLITAVVGSVHGISRWLSKKKEKSNYETTTGNGSVSSFENGLQGPSRYAKDKVTNFNVLAEDDVVEFQSLFSIETFHYLFPCKKIKVSIVFHSLISGVMCGIGLYYLLPSTITKFNISLGPAIIMHLLGWFSICNAQYSLTVSPPPEVSSFRLTDSFEIICLSRPFYILLLLMVEVASWHHPQVGVVSFAFHIVLIFLSVLWLLGLLPPIDALIPFLAEQVYVHLFGGSPMTGGLRLSVMLIISCISLIISTLVNDLSEVMIVATLFGYMLSLDLTTGIHQLITMSERKKPPDSSLSIKMDIIVAEQGGFMWKWTKKELLFHLIIMCSTAVYTGVLGSFDIKPNRKLTNGLAYCLLSMLILIKLLEDFQCIYVCFGLIRNKFYPTNTQQHKEFRKTKGKLKFMSYVRKLCLEATGPLLMITYLIIFGLQYRQDIPRSLYILCCLRAFRWVWQKSWHSLVEIVIAHFINDYALFPQFTELGLYLELLIISLILHRGVQFLKKLYFYFVLLLTFGTSPKQRVPHYGIIIALNLLFFPFVIVIIASSCILSMPLLPFFTMPIFFMGFPRHQRFWPSQAGKSSNICSDTIYYKQIIPNLVRSLNEALISGSLGGVNGGDHFLMRYLDRTIWMIILEKGYGYCKVNFRGLELQETSCHTIEVARIDEMFERAFEPRETHNHKCFNPYPLCVMTPCDSIIVNAYSDARSVLTGIIDNHENLKAFPDLFLKSLLWLLLHFNIKLIRWEYEEPEESTDKKHKNIIVEDISKDESVKKELTKNKNTAQEQKEKMKTVISEIKNKENEINEIKDMENEVSNIENIENESDKKEDVEKKQSKKRKSALKKSDKKHEIKITPCNFGSTFITVKEASNPINNKDVTSLPLEGSRSLSRDSIDNIPFQWSNSDDLFENKPGFRRQPNTGFIQSTTSLNNDGDIPGSVDSSEKNSISGMPAMDVGRMSRNSSDNDHQTTLNRRISQTSFVSPFSIQVAPLSTWMDIPLSSSQVRSIHKMFPVEWYRHVIYTLKFKVEEKTSAEVAAEISTDPRLEEIYQDLVLGCYLIVNMMGVHGVNCTDVGPSHIYKVFSGNIPWSPSSEWLEEEPELKKIILKAYRYAVKLMLDKALFGEMNTLIELQETLEDYEKNWFIGPEKEEKWNTCIQENKANLFSVGFNPIENTYTGRHLSHQDLMIHIGKLNSEVAYGIWASLNLELLYFTNDDEERYSIQAHPTILRNLTIQASDPPLGYPIYNSRPIVIPLLENPCRNSSLCSFCHTREYTTM